VYRLILTESQRLRLKQPLGELVKGPVDYCTPLLKEIVSREKPTCLLLVGDTISRTALNSNINPDVIIIDNMEMRAKALSSRLGDRRVIHVANEPGTIQPEVWKVVENAVAAGNSAVVVEGEEDLLTLVAILVAPLRSLVAYGQPEQGIVLVRVTPDKRKEIQDFVDSMERAS